MGSPAPSPTLRQGDGDFALYEACLRVTARLCAASFKTLWVRQTNCHSARTFSKPRSENRRKPRASLICPNTGSTVSCRSWYRTVPRLVLSLRRIRSAVDN